MKRAYFSFILTTFILITISTHSLSQNLQLHYNFTNDRQYLTSTIESLNPDKAGYTFFFVDMDYDVGDVVGVSSAYLELSRTLNLGKSPFALHGEYNGGFMQWRDGDQSGAIQFDDAWLAGMEYAWNDSSFSKGFIIQTLYKYIREKHNLSFQLTGVWYLNLLQNKVSFLGYGDFWREDFTYDDGKTTKYSFYAEPQLWYNFNTQWSAGSEVKITNNFGNVRGFKAYPTIGVKWTLK